MTTTRYFLARVALAFGVSMRQRRMAEAAVETHLLREAEQVLGSLVWNQVEDVEELGIEYWNLRRLIAERDRLRETLETAEKTLTEAHEQRAQLLNETNAPQQSLDEERREMLANLDALAKERDEIINTARELRRLYDGLKTKLEVLRSEDRDDQATIDRTRKRMADLRTEFESLRIKRDAIARNIEAKDGELDAIETRLETERKKNREQASETFQLIGDANRKISSCKAELGLIESRMQQLFGEIGRHVSRNIAANPACRAAASKHRSMVDVMGALRKSINLNHRLAGV